MKRSAQVLLAVSVTGLLIAACASSAKTPHHAHGALSSPTVKYAACIRAHGVPSFPDPPGGGPLVIPNDIDPSAPAFVHAQNACRSLMPGGNGPQNATVSQKASLLAMSHCMRAQGVSGFPDPVSSPPANASGMALAFGRPGAFLVIPDSLNPHSPKFTRAAKLCHLPGT